MTTRRCHGCGHFHDKRDSECPECGTPKHAFNAGLAGQQWATALNDKARWAKENN